jgi:hypothetical protein
MTTVHMATERRVDGDQRSRPTALCGAPLNGLYVRTNRTYRLALTRVCPVCVAIGKQRPDTDAQPASDSASASATP